MMEDLDEDQGLGQDFNVNLVLENLKDENVKTILSSLSLTSITSI